MGQGVSLKEIVEKMNLKNLTPDVDLVEKYVQVPDINRPALQLSGYFDHFDSDRVQVIGYVEYTYLQTLEEAKKMKMYDELLSHKIPCLIFSRALEPDQELLEKATQADTPVLITQKSTSSFMAELIRWMNVKLAPCISIHGVLVDVYRASWYWNRRCEVHVWCAERQGDTEYRSGHHTGRLEQRKRIRSSRTGRDVYGISGQQSSMP